MGGASQVRGRFRDWGAIVLILVAMDACNWFVHLANHRVRMLWRFHELHHSQEDMNVLTVFRTHPLIHVSYVLAVVPALVLLANGEMPTLLLVVYGGAVAFAHSNTNLGFGPLERVFVSPNYHRIHHRLRGPQDVNLGFTLTIWDQLSHRAVFPTPETIRADTGLPQRPLRVEQQGSRPHHLTVLAAQLVGPFRPLNESRRAAHPSGNPDIDAATQGRSHRRRRASRWQPRDDERAGGARRRSTKWLRLLVRDDIGRAGGGRRAAGRTDRPGVGLHLLRCREAVRGIPGRGPSRDSSDGALHGADGASSARAGSLPCSAGVTEFGGGIAMALGLCTRLAGLALFGDMVMAMITVTWATGINSTARLPATS